MAPVPCRSASNASTLPEQARQWTDRYHAAGFQQMKIYSSVKLEEVKVVADEAHRLGMTVTGHVPEGLNAYQVIEAGQDQINHIGYIADIMHVPFPADMSRDDKRKATASIDLESPEAQKALAFLKDHHTVVDPTMALFEFFTATTAKPPASFEPGVNKIAPELAEQLTDVGPPSDRSETTEKVFEKELAIVGALHRAGIPIVAGTDQTVPGYSLHREIELYVQAGFTPMEAIQAATIVPARVMGLDREFRNGGERQARRPDSDRRRSARRHPQHPKRRVRDHQWRDVPHSRTLAECRIQALKRVPQNLFCRLKAERYSDL